MMFTRSPRWPWQMVTSGCAQLFCGRSGACAFAEAGERGLRGFAALLVFLVRLVAISPGTRPSPLSFPLPGVSVPSPPRALQHEARASGDEPLGRVLATGGTALLGLGGDLVLRFPGVLAGGVLALIVVYRHPDRLRSDTNGVNGVVGYHRLSGL